MEKENDKPKKGKPETRHQHLQIVKRSILKQHTGFFKSLSTRTTFFKKVFSNLGYSEQDSQTMAKQLKEDVKEAFQPQNITLELDSAETGETLILYKSTVPDVSVGSKVRHHEQNFVVTKIQENRNKGLVEYRLKHLPTE